MENLVPPGRLCRLGLVIDERWEAQRRLQAARLAAAAGYGALWVTSSEALAEIQQLDLPIAVEQLGDAAATPTATLTVVTAVVGRTRTEANARADMDSDFPDRGELHGSLEDCQSAVGDLAAAGATDLALVIPAVPDMADLLAQLSAVNIGTLATVHPSLPRSPDPEPPPWGG